MDNCCAICNKENCLRHYDHNKERIIVHFFSLNTLIGFINIRTIMHELGKRKLATSTLCKTCRTIFANCPYCNESNTFNDWPVQRCKSCNKKFYNYL